MEQKEWQSLSRGERRRLKREQKRVNKEKEKAKKNLLKWASIFVILVVIGSGFFLVRYINAKRYENASKIKVTPTAHNFGKVQASEGVVETSFEVKNIGTSSLVVSGMETSCGCTTVILKYDGEESPVFGMHNNPTEWSVSLGQDEEAMLVVVFDPNFHKDSFGSITRTISIFSNDPGKNEARVNIYADVYK